MSNGMTDRGFFCLAFFILTTFIYELSFSYRAVPQPPMPGASVSKRPQTCQDEGMAKGKIVPIKKFKKVLDIAYCSRYTVCMAIRATKTQQIGVRVVPKEKQQFERAAAKESTTVSEWLRRLGHAELKRSADVRPVG
jgi:hypothetical protein